MLALGLVEGEHYVMETLYAEGHYERLPGLAAELVRRKVDLMLTLGTPGTLAAQKTTTTIPIVMVGVGDPVESGIVKSLARPGGNITGLSNRASDLGPKCMDLLLDVQPKLSRVAVLVNPANPIHPEFLMQAQAAAQARGLKVVSVAARTPEEIDSAFSEISRENAGAVIVVPDGIFWQQRDQIAVLAMKGRLSSVADIEGYPEAGVMMGYGSYSRDQYRRVASYVAKILREAKPADLPVEQESNLRLIINLKTAKALGLTIPQSLLLRADQVIE